VQANLEGTSSLLVSVGISLTNTLPQEQPLAASYAPTYPPTASKRWGFLFQDWFFLRHNGIDTRGAFTPFYIKGKVAASHIDLNRPARKHFIGYHH